MSFIRVQITFCFLSCNSWEFRAVGVEVLRTGGMFVIDYCYYFRVFCFLISSPVVLS